MSKINLTYDRITRYLRGLLSNRERHDLEKEMMQDVFEEEAFEGFNQLTANALESDMESLTAAMDQRLKRDKKKSITWFYRVAAGIMLLAGMGTVLYMVLKPPRAEMITQQVTKEEAPETIIPSAPVLKKSESGTDEDQKGIVVKQVKKDVRSQPATEISEGKNEAVVAEAYDEVRLPEENEDFKITAPEAAAAQSSAEKSTEDNQQQYISGRVLGTNREALAGVSVVEKGTSRGTVTDMDGNFRLQVRDSEAPLTLNYLGYKAVELPAGELSGKEISLDEDLIALNEVVVIGYGTQNKTRSERTATETMKNKRVATSAPDIYNKPVPPGGTMRQFEKWVEDRIDTKKFMELLPGNYRISVTLLINPDGSLGNITVKDDVPEVVSEEYKRVVAQSPVWQPALIDNTAVEAEVMIPFSLRVE